MSVRPVSVADTFWTIMSMLISASAQVWKISAALPGWSGTPTTVILASLRSWATPAMIGASTVSPSAGLSVTMVPSFAEKELRTWIGMSKRRAYSTLRRCSTFEPRGGQLEHLLVGDAVDLAGSRDDSRVGGEDPVDVGVDLADLGVERGGERDGGRVGAAAAQGGDLLGVLADALEPGDDDDVPLVEGVGDAARGDVDDPRLAVRSSR